MANEIIMSKLGVDVQEGEILEQKKAEGDEVNKGDVLLEIVLDKTNMEIEAEDSGVLLKIVHPAGDVVAVTGIIDYIGAEGEILANSAGERHAEQLVSAQEAKTQLLRASAALTISRKTSETRKVHATSATRELACERDIDPKKITGSGENGRTYKEGAEQSGKIRATPLTRRIAKSKGVDLETLVGTGVPDKITEEDVLVSLGDAAPQKERVDVKVTPQAGALADVTAASDGVKITRMSATHKAVSREASHSYLAVLTFTLSYDVNMANLIALREQFTEPIMVKTGYKVAFMDLIRLAMIKTLTKEEHRFLNASLINDVQDVGLHHFVNLVIAIRLSEGLVVPVAHGADQMSLSDFVVASRDVIQKAQVDKLRTVGMPGSTFTITNLGVLEVKPFSPITNQLNLTILGISATTEIPAVYDDEVVTRPVMRMSLIIGHRLVDGMSRAKFILDLKAFLENSLELLI